MEHHAAHELDVEVAHGEPTASRLPDEGEGLGEDLVELDALDDASPEGVRALPELGVGQRQELVGEAVHGEDARAEALDVSLVLGAEDLAEHEVDHAGFYCTATRSRLSGPGPR